MLTTPARGAWHVLVPFLHGLGFWTVVLWALNGQCLPWQVIATVAPTGTELATSAWRFVYVGWKAHVHVIVDLIVPWILRRQRVDVDRDDR